MTESTLVVEDYPKLKEAYDLAVEENEGTFIFKGQIIVTDFAKYALEYIKPYHEKNNA